MPTQRVLESRAAGKPKLAVYKFSSCDGCQLQLLNLEDELLDLVLDGRHPLAHVEDNLDARQVHAEVPGKLENHLQALDVLLGVEAGIAFAARGLQQPLALVEPKSLRVDLVLLAEIMFAALTLRLAINQTWLQMFSRGSSGLSLASSRRISLVRSSRTLGGCTTTSTI